MDLRPTTRRWIIPLALALLFVTSGFTSVPTLIDTLGSIEGEVMDQNSIRKTAPVICVATVLDNSVLVRNKHAVRFPKVSLDLHRVKILPELTLRGSLGSNEAFYYYARSYYSWSPYYNVMFEARPGRRYIFFLRMESGVLRSIGDVGRYPIRVLSGAHPQYRPSPGELGPAVADILLLRGQGANDAGLAQTLLYVTTVAEQWGNRPHTIELVRRLLAEPDPLHTAACFALTEYFADETTHGEPFDCPFFEGPPFVLR